MFSGIVTAIGRIDAREARGGDVRLWIDATTLGLDDVAIGDSIAVAGVCLTVVALDGARFAADVSNETLACTTLARLAHGDAVNLEKALRYGERVGGHLVSGHVDGVARVRAIADDGRAQRWTFDLPAPLLRFVAPKGSICLDGASLTVNEVDACGFGVALIPHTIAATTFAQRRAGDAVNVEVDLVARYLDRLTSANTSLPPPL